MLSSARPTRTWIALFAGLILQSFWIAVLCLLPDAEGARTAPHAKFRGLHVAPPVADQEPFVLWVAAAYGASVFLTLLALLALGLRGGFARRSFLGASFVLLGCYGGMWISYFLAPSSAALFGLPAASAWLLFGLWPAEALFALVFVLHFRTSYWSAESEQRFQELLLERGTKQAAPEAEA